MTDYDNYAYDELDTDIPPECRTEVRLDAEDDMKNPEGVQAFEASNANTSRADILTHPEGKSNTSDSRDARQAGRNISLSRLTAPKGKILSKHYELNAAGKLEKKVVAAFFRGTYETLYLSGLEDFVALLNSTTPSQALLYSVCKGPESGKFISEAYRNTSKSNEVSRTKQFFGFSHDLAIFAGDIDAPQEGGAPSKAAVVDAMVQTFPKLKATGVAWAASASSHLYDKKTGKELRGLTGQRLYFVVKHGTDIPRLFGVLIARLYLAGYGRFEISSSGSLLERSLIDKAMATPIQPDFCGGSSCGPGVVQLRPHAELLWAGESVDSKLVFPDLTDAEKQQYDAMRKADKAKLAQEAAKIREEWLEKRAAEIVQSEVAENRLDPSNHNAVEQARYEAKNALVAALDSNELLPNFLVELDSGEELSVLYLLRHSDRYDGRLCYDPNERGYDGRRVVGKLFLSGKKPVLHSQAHGGQTYFLSRTMASFEVIAGRAAQCVDETMVALRQDATTYSLGEALVQVQTDATLHAFTPATLTHFLGMTFGFFKTSTDDKGELALEYVNPPLSIARTIIELGRARAFRQLIGVVTAPTMMADGTLVTERGFHEKTGLYLQPLGDDWPAVPMAPTQAELVAAFETLWKPLSLFPWAGPVDRGVAFAGQLTAIVRRCLRIAPGFAGDAPTQSSGKTIFAQSLAVLGSGVDEPVTPYASAEDDTEMKKTLLSVALAGKHSLIIDNVLGIFENSALAATVTGGTIEGRVLGASKMSGSLPFRALLCLTGNNMVLGADLSHRILIARIDPLNEQPHLRKFDIHPVEWTLEHRTEMVVAGLTLLQGFVVAGMPVMATGTSRFPDWDRLVRQAVIWVSQELKLDFGDPLEAIENNRQQDPNREALAELLELWHKNWGDAPLTVPEIHRMLEEYEASRSYLRGMNRLQEIDEFQRQFLEIFCSWGQGGKLPTSKSIGNILKFRADNLVNGYRLERGGTRHGNKQSWRVRRVDC